MYFPLVSRLLLGGDGQCGRRVAYGVSQLCSQVTDTWRPVAVPLPDPCAKFNRMDFVPATAFIVVAGVVNPSSHYHEQIASYRVRIVHVPTAERRIDVARTACVAQSEPKAEERCQERKQCQDGRNDGSDRPRDPMAYDESGDREAKRNLRPQERI